MQGQKYQLMGLQLMRYQIRVLLEIHFMKTLGKPD